jgi:hypothetical protein
MRSNEDLAEEVCALRDSMRKYSEQISVLETENKNLKTAQARDAVLIDSLALRIQGIVTSQR